MRPPDPSISAIERTTKSDLLMYDQMFRHAPALITVHRGPEHIYMYSNAAHDRLLGDRDLIGKPLRAGVPDLAGQGLYEMFDRAFRNNETVTSTELEIRFNRGSELSATHYFHQVLQPWYDANGDIAGVISFSSDITELVESRFRAENSERHLSFALEIGGSIGVFECDMKRDEVKVDGRFLQAFGLDPEHAHDPLPIEDFFGAVHADDIERVRATFADAVANCSDYEDQYRLSIRGRDRFVMARGRCLKGKDDKTERFTGVMFDITKQHESEHALRASEALLRSVMTSLDQAYCVAEMIHDSDGEPIDYRFVEVNPQFEKMSGLKDAAGRSMLEMVPDFETKWAQTYSEVAYGGETLRFEDYSESMGRIFDIFATPVLPLGRFAVVFRDTTAERQMEMALKKSEAEFRTITEAMPQLVFRADANGKIDFYSSAWYDFTGREKGPDVGEGLGSTIHPEDFDDVLRNWRDAVRRGQTYEGEYRLLHHSGEYRWVLTRSQPLRDDDSKVSQWLGTSTDIHAIKTAEEQRQLMLGEMNHRVKNSLAMVHAMVSQTLRKADNLTDARLAVESRISVMAQAHDRLVNATWTEARITDVADAALASHMGGNGHFNIAGPDLAIGAKQALALTMALHELATNATKYGALSSHDGHVDLSWDIHETPQGDRFTLCWSETGGPTVQAPSRKGFGSRMIEQALAVYFHGEAELRYDAAGLNYKMSCPATGLTE